jgi:hypothetical protein
MSKLFYDRLIVLDEVEVHIKRSASSKEEQEEFWGLVDEIVSHRVIEKILDKLPSTHHTEFLEIFHKCPHDEALIFGFLSEKTGEDMEETLKRELSNLPKEILKELNG